VSIGIAAGAMFAVFLFLTYYLQCIRGYSPITTGLAFLPLTAAVMITAVVGMTKLQGRFGPRPLAVGGMLSGAAGMLILSRLGVNATYASDILPALIVMGVGLGLVFSTTISNGTLGVQPSDAGVASATVTACQQIGGSVGTGTAFDDRGKRRHELRRRPAPQRGADRARGGPWIHDRVRVGGRHLRPRRGDRCGAVHGPSCRGAVGGDRARALISGLV
jgi:hypothetical protein